MDVIELAGMSFYGYHGVRAEERSLGQRFTVDVRLELDLAPAGREDDLASTVDYADVWRSVQCVAEGPPARLIETVGTRIIDVLFERFERVEGVSVRIAKPWAPIADAHLSTVAVELRRVRPKLHHQGPDAG